MKISGIFEKLGEARFRALEARAVEEACAKKGSVLSLGGGAILKQKSALLVKDSFIVVWLWASADEALRAWKAIPPALSSKGRQGKSRAQPTGCPPAIYAACADIVVGTEGKTANEVADAIMDETAARR